ncbi:hypothetical protein Ancab_025779 [Ancistrocladus abbreviatus]
MSKLLVPWDHLSHMASLHYQCAENKELQERIKALEQLLSSGTVVKESSSPQQDALDEYTEELKKKVQYQASKQREETLEAALAEKEFAEEECRKKVDEAKKREASLENDLANTWVLVAKLKKEGGAIPDSKSRGCHRVFFLISYVWSESFVSSKHCSYFHLYLIFDGIYV